MNTSDTGLRLPRSTLHQGSVCSWVCVQLAWFHRPSKLPSTALLAAPPPCCLKWAVFRWRAMFSDKTKERNVSAELQNVHVRSFWNTKHKSVPTNNNNNNNNNNKQTNKQQHKAPSQTIRKTQEEEKGGNSLESKRVNTRKLSIHFESHPVWRNLATRVFQRLFRSYCLHKSTIVII